MANFNNHIDKTLAFEGGWFKAEHTYRGIMREHNPNWSGWKVVDKKQPLKHNQIIPELEQQVKDWYKKQYWDRICLDEVCNEKVAGLLFDFYVNSGNHAIKTIQRIIGVKDDGIIGAKTLYAINNYEGNLFEQLKTNRIGFFKSIVKNNPSKQIYLKGWLNRINSFT